jgi:hypothetical protein
MECANAHFSVVCVPFQYHYIRIVSESLHLSSESLRCTVTISLPTHRSKIVTYMAFQNCYNWGLAVPKRVSVVPLQYRYMHTVSKSLQLSSVESQVYRYNIATYTTFQNRYNWGLAVPKRVSGALYRYNIATCTACQKRYNWGLAVPKQVSAVPLQ